MSDVQALQHDDVTRMLALQIENGVNAIHEANAVLLADSGETGVREIDKALKDFNPTDDNDVSDKDPEIVKAVKQLEQAKKALKTAQEKARNLYRTKVLGEDEVNESETEVDVETVKAQRKTVMEAVTLLVSYADMNKKQDIVEWAKSLEIPQVGRQGTSAVGQKKPRARVTVGDKTYENFGDAAKAIAAELSTEDKKVTLTSPDLVSAWVGAGEAETFEFNGFTVKVTPKEKAAA